ncbi:lamin tail domain-containing protein, partial [Candidatus Parcubacteria bacterium]
MGKRSTLLALAALAFAAGLWLFSGTGKENMLLASLKDAFFPRPRFQLLAEVDPRAGEIVRREEAGEISSSEKGQVSPERAGAQAAPPSSIPPREGAPATVRQQKDRQGGSGDLEKPKTTLPAVAEAQNREKEEDKRPCAAKRGGVPAAKVLFNEIAWMGTEHSPQDEWIELRNWENREVDLSGWRVQSADGKFALVIADHRRIPARGYFLLERSDDATVPQVAAGAIYEGTLRDAGMHLLLLDGACVVVDEINASGGWQQYGGDRATRRTLERDADLEGWHTSANVGGTPGK